MSPPNPSFSFEMRSISSSSSFANHDKIDPASLRAQAETLGLDLAKYDASFAKAGALVEADKAQGQKLGVRGTPSFFINGRMLTGAQPYETFDARVKEELAAKG